jgi:hypothetical protein
MQENMGIFLKLFILPLADPACGRWMNSGIKCDWRGRLGGPQVKGILANRQTSIVIELPDRGAYVRNRENNLDISWHISI